MMTFNSVPDAELRELAPSGILRVAIALSPAPSPFFATADPTSGAPRGVTVTLGSELAAALGLPLAFVQYPNSGEITDRADNGEWDVTFMPADAERAKRVDFSPPYVLVESTYLVAPGCRVQTMEEIDRTGLRIVAIDNTATARSAARTVKHAALVYAATVDEAFAQLRSRQVEAMALSRDALAVLAEKLPGSRMLEGRFHAAGVAGAVPKGRPNALTLVTAFIETAKASGRVQRALDAAGLKHAVVAPSAQA
ncbi:MAG: transporter substrate-binding domain-containing protein [Xanthobacteraceae bacterium]